MALILTEEEQWMLVRAKFEKLAEEVRELSSGFPFSSAQQLRTRVQAKLLELERIRELMGQEL